MAKQDRAEDSSAGPFNRSEAISHGAADATGFAANIRCASSGLAPAFVKTDTGWRIYHVHNTPINREVARSNVSQQLARIEGLLTDLLLLLEKIAGDPCRGKE